MRVRRVRFHHRRKEIRLGPQQRTANAGQPHALRQGTRRGREGRLRTWAEDPGEEAREEPARAHHLQQPGQAVEEAHRKEDGLDACGGNRDRQAAWARYSQKALGARGSGPGVVQARTAPLCLRDFCGILGVCLDGCAPVGFARKGM